MLDSNWQVLEQIPIDVGPRHFTVSGAQPALPDPARKGDRWASSTSQIREMAPVCALSSNKLVVHSFEGNTSAGIVKDDECDFLASLASSSQS